jgi:hypothetical protein
VALAAALTGCASGDPPAARPTPCVTPSAVTDTSALPDDLPLEEYGAVVAIEVEDRSVGATAVSETQIVELYPPLARAVLDAGYDIVASENDGIDAEIFFTKGRRTGAYRLLRGPCAGQVTIRLLHDRGAS